MSSLVWKLSRDLFLFRRTPISLGVDWLDEHFFIGLPNQLLMNVDLALGLLLSHVLPVLVESDVSSRFGSEGSGNQTMTLEYFLLMLNDWFKHHESN